MTKTSPVERNEPRNLLDLFLLYPSNAHFLAAADAAIAASPAVATIELLAQFLDIDIESYASKHRPAQRKMLMQKANIFYLMLAAAFRVAVRSNGSSIARLVAKQPNKVSSSLDNSLSNCFED